MSFCEDESRNLRVAYKTFQFNAHIGRVWWKDSQCCDTIRMGRALGGESLPQNPVGLIVHDNSAFCTPGLIIAKNDGLIYVKRLLAERFLGIFWRKVIVVEALEPEFIHFESVMDLLAGAAA